jgi:transcriptional regulator with XRE-family HTH domain
MKEVAIVKIQKNIAATLKAAMAEKDLTLVEFAEEIGIARTSLQGYLKEESNPRADTIELLSERLNISPSELISGPEASTPNLEELPEDQVHPLLIPLVQQCHCVVVEIARLSAALSKLSEEGELV